MSRRELAWAALVFLVALVIWGAFAAGELFIGDSPELAGAAARLGVAHPPGYPTFLLVSHLFLGPARASSIPLATAANALALLAAAAGVSLFWLGLRRFGLSRIPAAIGALAWACGPLVTGQALTYEVHALQHLLLGGLFLFIGQAAAGEEEGSPREGLALAFLSGLVLTNHYSAAVLLPLVGWGLWRSLRGVEKGRRALWLGLAVAAFVLPLSAYLYLPLRAGADLGFDYGMTGNLPNLWAHLTGRGYAYAYIEQGLSAQALPAAGRAVFDSIPWPLWALAPLGLVGLFRERRGPAFAGLITPLLLVPLLLFYRIVDPLDYLAPLVMLAAFWCAFGAERLRSWLKERRALGAALAATAAALCLGWWLVSGMEARRPLSGRLARAGAEDFLRELTPGALYFGEGDDALFGPLLLTAVEDVRPDVLVLDEMGTVNRGPLGPVYPALFGQARKEAQYRFARRWAAGGGAVHVTVNTIPPHLGVGLQRPVGLTYRLAYPDSPALETVNRQLLPGEPWRYNRLAGLPGPEELEPDDPYLGHGMGFSARLRGLAADQLTCRAVAGLEKEPLSPLGPKLLRRALRVAPAGLVSLSRVAQAAHRGAVWGLCVLETGLPAAKLPEILLPWLETAGGVIAFDERLPDDPRSAVVRAYLDIGGEAAEAASRFRPSPEMELLLALALFGRGDYAGARRAAEGIRAPSARLAPLLDDLRRELGARLD